MDEEKIIRKCVACNSLKSRKELIKITVKKNNTGSDIMINPDSKFFGRSAYICRDKTCIDNAFKKGRFFKILKIKPDDSIKEKIRAVLEE